jgi:glycosyltransferase involved in cell wall biosynthesis
LRQYSAFLTIGQSNAEFYRSHGISETQMFPGRYCVDNERFSTAADRLRPRCRELRSAWGIAPDTCVFLYCGKFIPKKHPLTLVRGAAAACSRGARLHLLLVGDGELREACELFAKARKIPATFAGFLNQSRLPEAYVAADCLVLPSDTGETWGLVVNEAMTCGLPAIVSDQVGCGPDLISDGETGAVFPCGDEQKLGDVLSQFAADRKALEQMGSAARERVAGYSIQALTEGTVQALDFVCGSGRTPGGRGSCRADEVSLTMQNRGVAK